MIFRLEYKNRNGLQARLDITTPGSSIVEEIEGTGNPFLLSYKGDKSDKSSHFLTSSAEINIYETPEFNIDKLKTSSETQIKVDHYIDNELNWTGFVIPDFFSREIGGAGVVSMTASDRISTLKGVTLSDLPAMVQIRDLAVRCLERTGLDLPLKTMADFRATELGFNQYFRSEITSQRLYDSKGRSISCYDILKSILVASGSTLRQRGGEWHIINKLQHEAGVGRVYSTENTSVNYVESVHHFDEIVKGARRTIIPVAGSVGIYHEYGGGKLHPDNYDFSQELTGWTPVGGFVAGTGNQSVNGYKIESGVYVPDYGEAGLSHLKNANAYQRNVNPIYLESAPISVPYSGSGAVNIEFDINGVGPMLTTQAVMRIAIVAQKGGELLTLHHGGAFAPMPSANPPVFEKRFKMGFTSTDFTAGADTQNMRVSGTLESSELEGWELRIRIYGGGSSNTILINAASIHMKSSQETPKGAIYKRDQGADFTKTHDIETAIFGDYLTTGKDGYFYDYPIDDTSSIHNPYSGISSLWTTPYFPTETDALPILQHVVRQQARMFSVAHDLISGEIEIERFDPLSIFVDCNGNRHVIVSASFDFLRSSVKVELEEIAYANLTVRDYIYSYFGEGESGISSVGGIASGTGGGSGVSVSWGEEEGYHAPLTVGGETKEVSLKGHGHLVSDITDFSDWFKYDSLNDAIYTEKNLYTLKELSAYGLGSGGGSGGSDYERLDTWASYDSSKAGWVLSAFLGNDLNTRVTNLENSAGSGSVTSVGISVPTGLSVSNSPITSSGVIAIGLQTGYSIPTTAKQGQWDGVVTDFGNLEIGGRNLVLNSNVALDISTPTTQYQLRVWYLNTDGISLDDDIILTVTITVFEGFTASIWFNTLDPNPLRYHTNKDETITVSHKLKARQSLFETTIHRLYNYGYASTDEQRLSNKFIIHRVKLEKGTIATDWTPAPEDQVSDWNTTDVNSFSYIKNKPTTLAGYGITDAYTKTEVNSALVSKLDKSVFDDLFEKVEVSTGVFAIKAKYNFYGVGELSAYGIGSGGGSGGGGIIETVYGYGNLGQTFNNANLTDTFNAYTINQINTRLVSVESGSATTVNTTGIGDLLASVSKVGNNINFIKGNQSWGNLVGKPSTFTPSAHTHNASDINAGVLGIARIPTGTTSTTVALGNHTHTNYVAKSGDTMSGVLTINSDTPTPLRIIRPNNLLNTVMSFANNDGGVYIGQSSTGIFRVGGSADLHYNPNSWLSVDENGVTATTFIGALSGNATTATTATNLSRSIIAGNGLTGGGQLTASQTLTLGTPSTLTASTTNSVTDTSHTHQITGFLPLTGGTLTDILSIKSSSATLLTLERASTINANMVFKTSTNSVFIGQGSNGQLNVGGAINLSDSVNKWLSVDANSLIAHGVNGITAPSFNTTNWKLEQVGTELLLKYNDLIAARFLADGSIVGLGEITAYGEATTGGEGVSLLRTGGTMTGNLTMSADIIMNSGRAIGASNLPLKLLGNALTYNASNVLTEANTATQIKMGNGWTIEQTTASLTIRKDGVIKGTFNA